MSDVMFNRKFDVIVTDADIYRLFNWMELYWLPDWRQQL